MCSVQPSGMPSTTSVYTGLCSPVFAISTQERRRTGVSGNTRFSLERSAA